MDAGFDVLDSDSKSVLGTGAADWWWDFLALVHLLDAFFFAASASVLFHQLLLYYEPEYL